MHEEWLKNVNEKSKQICETSMEECEELLTSEDADAFKNNVIKFDYSNCRSKIHGRRDAGAITTQITAAFFASLSSVCIGFITAYSSSALPQLQNDTSINYDESRDYSWIGSLPSISSIPGSLAGGFLMDALGPKRTLAYTALPFILSWGFVSFASDISLLYIGRIITGIFLGIYSPVPQVYATEIAEPRIRGLMGAFPEAAVALGSLLCYGFGAFLDWRWLAVASALVPGVPLFLSMLVFPESPQWLVKKGKLEDAEKSLKFFRSSDHKCSAEVNMIRENIEQTEGADISIKDQLKLFKKRQNWLPVLIVFLVFMCGQFSGFAVVTAYMSDIFNAANPDLDPDVASVIVGSVRFFSTLVSALLLDRTGRRILLIISAIGSSVGMVILGVYFYIQDHGSVESIGWLPVTSLLIYVFFNELGYGPVPWLLSGELIPLAVRTIGNGVAVTAYSLFAFVIGYTYPLLTDAFPTYVSFWMYSVFSLSGVLLGWYLPETRGKTLEEIEKFFIPKHKQIEETEKSGENSEVDTMAGSQIAITSTENILKV